MVSVCGVKLSINLLMRNTVDREEESISCDYSNNQICRNSESLEHMLGSLRIQTLKIRYKVLPQRTSGSDNQITAMGTFHLIV